MKRTDPSKYNFHQNSDAADRSTGLVI